MIIVCTRLSILATVQNSDRLILLGMFLTNSNEHLQKRIISIERRVLLSYVDVMLQRYSQ